MRKPRNPSQDPYEPKWARSPKKPTSNGVTRMGPFKHRRILSPKLRWSEKDRFHMNEVVLRKYLASPNPTISSFNVLFFATLLEISLTFISNTYRLRHGLVAVF
jgi:hypothetical protein